MNWNDLNEIWERCKSKAMSVKEASNFVSVTYALVKFHTARKELYAGPNYEEEHEQLIQLSLDIYRRAHEKE